MVDKKWILSLIIIFALACGLTSDDVEVPQESPPLEQGVDSNEGETVSPDVDALMANYSEGPGGAMMVVQDGVIVHQNGYGFADVETSTPITTDTVFHLGSVGKQFTAMGVMMLAEEGALNYDDPISTHLPELAWMDDEVTIRRLLYHTSGIMGYDDSDNIYNALVASAERPGNDELLSVLAEQGEMLSSPGEEYSYSNTGYDLLGILIERLSGQSYPQFMEENIFGPLEMSHTFAVPNDVRLNAPEVAQSYSTEGAYEPDVLDALNGSGSIYSTLGDLYLYDQALLNNELVSVETLSEAFTSGALNSGEDIAYGFGWDIDASYVGHSGAWLGFESYYLHFTGQDLTVIVLLNLDYSNEGAEGIAFSVADLYLK
ncbi:MAG: hypothetical protein RIR73_703 [Chloroflexota bacterium]